MNECHCQCVMPQSDGLGWTITEVAAVVGIAYIVLQLMRRPL